MTKPKKNKLPNLPWQSALMNCEYDPLTGTYRYTEPPPKTNQTNQFWTSMGQPKRQYEIKYTSNDKKY